MTTTPSEPEYACPETSDGYHCGHWYDGTESCCACGIEPIEDDEEEG